MKQYAAARIALGIAVAGLVGCTATGNSPGEGDRMTYQVKRVDQPIQVDADWNKPVWRDVEPLGLKYHMGREPEHSPRTQAKLAYDTDALYVIFHVEDRYVRALARRHQDTVCTDSCVEFFFTPGTDPAAGYFNLEMNCGGTMLFHFQVVPRKDSVAIRLEDLERIDVAHHLPKYIDPEITEPTTWTVEYRLPVDMLASHFPNMTRPGPGVTWRANFFKCADATSKPHWLTWAEVHRAEPDFHVPEDFGQLDFQ